MADGFNSAFKGLNCYWSGRQEEAFYVNCLTSFLIYAVGQTSVVTFRSFLKTKEKKKSTI
jgi:hypothetical protein